MERVVQKNGYTIIVKGDLDRHDEREKEGGGIKGILESKKFPVIRHSQSPADASSKYRRAIDHIRKKVKTRPEHIEAGYQNPVLYETVKQTRFEADKKRQREINKRAKPDDMKMVGSIPQTVFNRRIREAGGVGILKDRAEAKKLFRDYRWD